MFNIMLNRDTLTFMKIGQGAMTAYLDCHHLMKAEAESPRTKTQRSRLVNLGEQIGLIEHREPSNPQISHDLLRSHHALGLAIYISKESLNPPEGTEALRYLGQILRIARSPGRFDRYLPLLRSMFQMWSGEVSEIFVAGPPYKSPPTDLELQRS